MTTTPVRTRTASAGADRARGATEAVDAVDAVDAVGTVGAAGAVEAAGIRRGPPRRTRGRHRRPRSRKALYAAGGFALAVGALSLLRPGSDPGMDTAGAGPRLRPTADSRPEAATGHPAGTTDATDVAVPVPPAPVPAGGTPASPEVAAASPPSVVRTPSGLHGPRTTPPAKARPRTPAPAASRSTTARPPGGSGPSGPTASPAPGPATVPPLPGPTGGPALCLPVVGLCVDTLTGPAD
ncbi:hypothetical protein L1856_29450 [Streptomyces sp. Tue 6430]|nr:hypothetical protein [Streptomyces sp. Tue 6430]